MSEFNWHLYDKWLTETPADRAHKEECNCDACHEIHKEDGNVEFNVKNYPSDYRCCMEEMERGNHV